MRLRPAWPLALAVPALLGGWVLAAAAAAQTVTLAGRMGERALLVVDGTPHVVAVAGHAAGVTLLGWVGEEAEVDLAGVRSRLRVGGTPAQIGPAPAAAAAREIVMTVGSDGHFTPAGSINGQSVRFLVDTGATLVSVGREEALRLGVDLANARHGVSQTANGPVAVQIVTLNRVRVGEVELRNVGALVVPQALPFVLLGNSFLSRFQMRRDNDVMRLQLR